jgi:hypothetical protein
VGSLTPENPEGGGDIFSETSVLSKVTQYKVIVTTVKASQKTEFFNPT